MKITHKQKVKIAKSLGGFGSEAWEKRKMAVKRRVHDVQTKAHIMAQIKRGEKPTLLNGDPVPSMIPQKGKKKNGKL